MIRVALILIHLLIGLSAIGAGQALAREPDGEALAFKTEWLKDSPFRDYRIPGLFLILVIAPTNLSSARSQLRRDNAAPYLSTVSGSILTLWIIIQTSIIGFRHWSQAIWAILFPATMLLGLLQLTKRNRDSP